MTGEAALSFISGALDHLAQRGKVLEVWWRDDDAVDTGPRLDWLAATAAGAGAPLYLAVIPDLAQPGLLAFCEANGIAVLQHGVAHENHQAMGKSAELGDARPAAEMITACVAARRKLEVCTTFQPVMVPPWNRIAPGLPPLLAAAGYTGHSMFGGPRRAGPLRRVDTHLDPIAWRTDRGLAAPAALEAMMKSGLDQGGPLGILTHHAVHDGNVDGFVEALAALVAQHPAARWAAPEELFGAV